MLTLERGGMLTKNYRQKKANQNAGRRGGEAWPLADLERWAWPRWVAEGWLDSGGRCRHKKTPARDESGLASSRYCSVQQLAAIVVVVGQHDGDGDASSHCPAKDPWVVQCIHDGPAVMAGTQAHLSCGWAIVLTSMSVTGHQHGGWLADGRSGLSGPDSIKSTGIFGEQLVNAASHAGEGEFALIIRLDVAWLFLSLAKSNPCALHGTAFSVNELSDKSATCVELNVPCHGCCRSFSGKQAT